MHGRVPGSGPGCALEPAEARPQEGDAEHGQRSDTAVDQAPGQRPPLLQGLEGDLCQSPHWGYVMEGKLTVTFSDGHVETTSSSDMFYWPPGHTVRAEEDTEMILFSPQHEHGKVIEHIQGKLADSH